MAADFTKLHAVVRANVSPGMLSHLAESLGVGEEALSTLGVGWLPVAKFKKGPNYQGWWAIPERDEKGAVVGLSLRGESGTKVMLSGSRHGLVYAVNPDHRLGTPAFVPGPQNWVRTAEAGIDCPVCHKPDGCLVSSEDPDDPQACICIRVPAGAARPMKLGYLHILKEAGRLSPHAGILPPSERPVVVVEGMTDSATAMGLGFVAVGRPSNLACMDMLREVLRGRDVLVVGENDPVDPHTGKRPGEEGAIAAFQTLRSSASRVRIVMPPEEYKDLRAWVTSTGISGDDLLLFAEENAREPNTNPMLEDARPLTAAWGFLDQCYRMAGRYTLRYYQSTWYEYRGPRYVPVENEVTLRGKLYEWAHDKVVSVVTSKGEQLQPVTANRAYVGNILDALSHPCPVEAESLPAWINGADGPDPSTLIPFANGLLRVDKYLDGGEEADYFLESTPDLFNTFALPYPFDPTATCEAWKRYLRECLGDEPAKIALLREWIGYCMTVDTSLHKLMLFRGAKRTGKSTALGVLQAVVGQDQAASVSFAQLTQQFGLQGLVGKQIAVMGDARLPRSSDSMRALELLLNIVGEDPVSVDRKFLPGLANHRLGCRFTLATNELPELPDHSGALEARLLILDFRKSFLGREDFGLRDRLIAEAPGIAVWALQGLKRLWANEGRFTVPEQSLQSLKEWRTTTSPMAAFLEECTEQGETATVPKDEFYDAWTAWSRERGLKPMSKGRSFERLKAQAGHIVSDTINQRGRKIGVFKGVTLTPWAERQYLRRP